MLKVLIADDEPKVCRLIQMVCDWDKLEMQVVSTAANGFEALEKIQKLMPDILITDICMPGINGLDLIQKVRVAAPQIEFLILSGYANFEYAQKAIRYGVRDYLLKPVRKDEINHTLQRLGQRCMENRIQQSANDQLRQHLRNDLRRRRCSLFLDVLLATPRQVLPSMEEAAARFSYTFQPGLFQMYIIKLDYDKNKYDQLAIEIVNQKIEDQFRPGLKRVCWEIEIFPCGTRTYLLCNYSPEKLDDLRRCIRECLFRASAQQFIQRESHISIGAGTPVHNFTELDLSLDQAKAAVNERLLQGWGKVLEHVAERSGQDVGPLLDAFRYKLDRALALMDEQELVEAVEFLQDEMEHAPGLCGTKLLDGVGTAGAYGAMAIVQTDNEQLISAFREQLDLCSQPDELFVCLRGFLCDLLEEQRQKRLDEERRPIRIAKQYIAVHFSEAITLETVAGEAGFSTSYFSGLFKKETGIGFNDYLIQVRMDQAKELLKNSNRKISDICTQVGYNDLKYFTQIFRKYSGLKPSEFRKLYS